MAKLATAGPAMATVILIGCIVVQFSGVGLPRYAYPILLPDMRADLGLNYFESGLVATGNFVGFMFAAFAGGLIAVRIGAARTIQAAVALCSVAMLVCAVAPGYIAVLVAQTVIGLGSGAVPPTAIGLAAQWVGNARRGLAIGLVLSAMGLALLATGVAVPALLAWSGWRGGWFALGILGLVALVVALFALRDPPVLAQAGPRPGLGTIYRSRAVWYYCLLGLATGSSNAVYTTFFAAWLVSERGMTVAQAGQLWALAGVASVASGVAWGVLCDRIGWGRTLVLMFGAQTFAIAAFTSTSVPLIAASGLVFGFTLMGYQVVAGAAITRLVPARLAPAGQSLSVLMFAVGQAIGPAVAGRAADLAGTLAPSFFGAAAVALIGAFAALFAPGNVQRDL